MSAFAWGSFSPKALQSIDESTARLNIWHGAVRSSKTVCSIVRWLEYVRTAPPGDLIMLGKTERTLKRNILDPIEAMVGPRRFHYSQGKGEITLFGRRIYTAGANDARSESKIRGLTVAGAYGDEITLWPEGVFKQLLARLSVRGAKLFGTTNPDSPFHWLKRDFLDRADELEIAAFHFTLDDNANLDPAYVAALRREYTGLWRRRFILGLWVVAEGAVYDMLDTARHVVDTLPALRRHWAGIDYGTSNPTVFLRLSQGEDERLYLHREWRWDSAQRGRQKTDAEYSADFRAWSADTDHQRVFYDPSAASFGLQLWRDRVPRLAAADNSVLDGIRAVASLLAADRLTFHGPSTRAAIEEFMGYTWDPKAQQRGEDKPLKTNDHAPDAARYVVRGTRTAWRSLITAERAA